MLHTADSIYSHMTDEDVVAMAQCGSSDATEHMMRRYSNFVEWRIRGFFLPGGDRDDLLQEGMIGLFKAIRDHNPGMPFRNFAHTCVSRQITTAVKMYTRQKHLLMNEAISLEMSNEEDGTVLSVDDRSPEVVIAERQAVEDIISLIGVILSPLEAAVTACFIEDDKYREAADRLGISLKCVDNARQRAKDKMGPALSRMEA